MLEHDPFLRDVEAVKDWIATHPAQAQLMVERRHKLRIDVARIDVNEFVEFVGRDESTGAPLVQAPVHEAFQRLCGEHRRLVMWGHIESGKTSQVAILRVLWLLGRNPNLRLAIVSRTASLARKILGSIKTYIEKSDALHEVFPNLRPGSKWSDQAITVAGRRGSPKDFSVETMGVGGAPMGARLDGVILDDVLDWTNTRTPEQRDQVFDWRVKQLAGRLVEDGFEWVLGNAWHPDDMLHTLERNPMWYAVRFPVVDAEGNLTWPERWSRERIDQWTAINGTAEAARQLYCVARSDEDARFKDAWIRQCLARGEGRTMVRQLKGLPLGYRTYTGVDVSTGEGKDKTCLFTLCLWPNLDREVLCVETGRWTGPEIVRRIVETSQRYHSIVAVESNAAQKFITQFTGGAAPVKNFMTGANKVDPAFGVESLAVEMERGQWIIPAAGGRPLTKEVEDWIRTMLYYSPSAHTGDELMACWIAREAACQRMPGKVRTGRQRVGMR